MLQQKQSDYNWYYSSNFVFPDGEEYTIERDEIKRYVPEASTVKDHLKVPAMTIAINYSDCNEGYMYTIHNGEPDTLEEDPNGFDRGLCTGTMEDALGMAVEQAEVLAGLLADKFDRETT